MTHLYGRSILGQARFIPQLVKSHRTPRYVHVLRSASNTYGHKRYVHSSIRKREKNMLSKLNFEEHYKIRSNIESLIQDYAKKPIPPLGFKFLTQYKHPLRSSQEYTFSIKTFNLILTYTCRQLNLIQRLPYIAILNPKIEESYSLYLKTLTSLLSNQFPYDLYNRNKMLTLLNEFLNDHEDTLVTLSHGLQEITEYYPRETIFEFLNNHLRNRISMKLLATHYINLIQDTTSGKQIGIIHKDLAIVPFINQTFEFVVDLCGLKYDQALPPLKFITMGREIKFTCIPIILEYVITEILKNSARAQIENNINDPIEITLTQDCDNELNIRISDKGGGISPTVEARMFDYSYSTVEELAKENGMQDNMLPGEVVNNVSGMGFGLPLCKTYLELFDGKIDIESIWGLGTDVYITVKGPTKEMVD